VTSRSTTTPRASTRLTSTACFFSKTLDAVGAQADSVFAELGPGLVDALVVGRPISS
jgi:hypothetical protein